MQIIAPYKLDTDKLKVYNGYIELFDDYSNSENEVKAQKAGENGRRKAENFDTRVLETAQNSYELFKKRYVGTNTWNNIGQTQKQNTKRYNNYRKEMNNYNIFFQEENSVRRVQFFAPK